MIIRQARACVGERVDISIRDYQTREIRFHDLRANLVFT